MTPVRGPNHSVTNTHSTPWLQVGLVCWPAPKPPPGAHGARNARVCTGLLAGLQTLARRGLARGKRFPLLGSAVTWLRLLTSGICCLLGLKEDSVLSTLRVSSKVTKLALENRGATVEQTERVVSRASSARMTTGLATSMLLLGREGQGQSLCKGYRRDL